VIPLPGEAKAGRDLTILLPGITYRITFLGLTKRSAALRWFGLQILDLGNPPPPADPLNPYFQMGVTGNGSDGRHFSIYE